MKRCALLLLAISFLVPSLAIGATQDDAGRAAAIAEKQEQEERARRVEASIRDILAAQEDQQKRIQDLSRQLDAVREENRRLRDDLLKAGANGATREDLKKLFEAVSQVDERRVKDNRLLTEALEKLGSKLTAPEPSAPVPPVKKAAPAPENPESDLGYWHTIDSGQSLSVIVQAYREQGIKVTQKQVMDANPNVNWNRLSVGKKIFIPDPAKAKSSEKPNADEKTKGEGKP
jgi:LysM repeat protein